MDKNNTDLKKAIMSGLMVFKTTKNESLEFARKFEAVRELADSLMDSPALQELRLFYDGYPDGIPIRDEKGKKITPGSQRFSYLRADRLYWLQAAGMEFEEAKDFIRRHEATAFTFEIAFREWKEKNRVKIDKGGKDQWAI
ncbi:MAG: hypothetical protein GTN82_15615 [Candidatus Aminicenantes bacterium]|nr:hypothetical protein [Candidatus Aminicenantes bacterium]